jgi:hypothetical protein
VAVARALCTEPFCIPDVIRGKEEKFARDMSKQQMKLYDLAVAYRIYPQVSKPARGLPFGDDKLRQAEICLRSFRNSLGPLRVKIWAILDGCPGEYRRLFERYFLSNDLSIVEVDAIGNQATYAKQLDILLSQADADVVYVAEDDYLYLPEQFSQMLQFLLGQRGVEFVTPYDHPDCYRLDSQHELNRLAVFGDHHWRTAASTCLTFLTRKSTLANYERALRTYSSGNSDCAMWLSLTKKRVFNPLALLSFGRESYWKEILKAWFFGWRQIVFGRAAKLWVPLPGLATHLAGGFFSPCIDFLSLMQGEIADFENARETSILRESLNSPG